MDNTFIRASSLPELFDCPARWEAKNLLGKRMPTSPQAHIGTSIHASTALFDDMILNGATPDVEETAGKFIDTLHDKDAEVDWAQLETKIQTVEKIGLSLHANYCTQISPIQNYTGVEVKCEALPIEFDELGVSITLTGSTDRIRKDSDGRFGISDLKSGKTAVKSSDGTVDTAKHAAQLAVYELLVESATATPITAPAQIIGLQTVTEARVAIGEIKSAREMLVGTAEQPGLLDAAARMLKGGLFYGNPRSMLCSKKFCPVFNECRWRS